MELTLNVLRCPDSVVPETRRVPGGEFRIGRGADCDWVLPDPDRVLSKHHCVLEFRSGGWQVRDNSTNGTFHNGNGMPIGRDVVALLQDGDRIRLGSYEIEVRVQQAAAAQSNWQAPPPAQQASWDAPLPTTPGWGAEPGWSEPSPPSGGRAQPIQPRLPGDAFPIGGPGSGAPGGMIPADFRLDDGPSMPDHASATSDAFLVPKPMQPANHVLPDDWSRPLSGTTEPAPAPPAPNAGGQMLPEAWNLGFDAKPAPAAAPPAPPPATPPPHPIPAAPQAAAPANPFDLEIAASPPPSVAPSAPPPVALPHGAAPLAAPPAAFAPGVAPAGGGSGLAALLAGAGLEAAPALAANPDATLRAAGAALRAAIVGLRALLHARADIKREFRIEQTMVGSNMVKFSHSDEAALVALLGAADGGPRAVQQSVDDLTAHQVATLAATQAAARALLQRLAPADLEAAEKGGGLFGASREKRLWEGYKQLHDAVVRQFDDDFDSAFGKAFARAYEQALRDGQG